jgi:PA14 domain
VRHVFIDMGTIRNIGRATTRIKLAAFVGLLCARILLGGGQQPKPVFSTTVFGSPIEGDGLRGLVYELAANTAGLPDFTGRSPVTTLYTKSLNIPPQDFSEGIPGVERVEWFAIEYSGDIWIAEKGKYHFEVLSDDGARLYLDDKQVINNDGLHPPKAKKGSVSLERGQHHIRIAYFQGPRQTIALVLTVKGPGSGWRTFNTDDFRAAETHESPPK